MFVTDFSVHLQCHAIRTDTYLVKDVSGINFVEADVVNVVGRRRWEQVEICDRGEN